MGKQFLAGVQTINEDVEKNKYKLCVFEPAFSSENRASGIHFLPKV